MRKALLAAVLAAAALTSAAAGGKGGPAPGVAVGWDGIALPGGKARLVALPAGKQTVLASVRTDGGRVGRFGTVAGRWGIPYVTWTGETGGLSLDGRTLILAQESTAFRRVSQFAVFDSRRFRLAQTVGLRGTFSFDAMSPDARTLYLTEHLSESNPLYYRIRAYDLEARKLLPRPIVDRTEPGEEMRGQAIARVAGPGARWVYTLYGGGKHPFIHALDTVARTARCLDFHWAGTTEQLWQARLGLSRDAKKILLLQGGRTVLSVAAP